MQNFSRHNNPEDSTDSALNTTLHGDISEASAAQLPEPENRKNNEVKTEEKNLEAEEFTAQYLSIIEEICSCSDSGDLDRLLRGDARLTDLRRFNFLPQEIIDFAKELAKILSASENPDGDSCVQQALEIQAWFAVSQKKKIRCRRRVCPRTE